MTAARWPEGTTRAKSATLALCMQSIKPSASWRISEGAALALAGSNGQIPPSALHFAEVLSVALSLPDPLSMSWKMDPTPPAPGSARRPTIFLPFAGGGGAERRAVAAKDAA